MRLVSQYGKYRMQYQAQKVSTDSQGVMNVIRPGIYLEFVQGDLYQNEYEQALGHFGFKGQFQHQDEATPVDPSYRISTFDTSKQNWEPEQRHAIEEWLKVKAVGNPDFFIVTDTPVPKPFPRYDEWTGPAMELVERLYSDGYDLEQVLLYETRFGPNRPDIVEALTDAVESLKDEVVPA